MSHRDSTLDFQFCVSVLMMYESLIRNLILEHGNAFPHIERSFFHETADKKKPLKVGIAPKCIQ